MVKYRIVITERALKDRDSIKQYPALQKNVSSLLKLIGENPYQNPPPYEILAGDLKGLYSRRINRQHRLVYKVDEEEHAIVIVSMWTYYEF